MLLKHQDVTVRVDEAKNGKRRISVESRGGTIVGARSWETAYPVSLIEQVLNVKGAYVADEIMRDEAPLYVQNHFKWGIFSYVERDGFADRRLLDFGCGSGASVMVLARMLPGSTEFVGVELIPEYVELARQRARWYGVDNRATFLLSPDPNSLPYGIGSFDYILLSAVFEHLLPAERRSLLPSLWEHLKPGGILFLDQTPFRWFPIEMHTTGLPLLNYLPDSVALWAARRFSRRVRRDEKWSDLLRRGIRGATAGEVLGSLNEKGLEAELLNPSRQGVRDPIDLWVKMSSASRGPIRKRAIGYAFRAIKATTGISTIPTLSLAVRKVE